MKSSSNLDDKFLSKDQRNKIEAPDPDEGPYQLI